MLRKKSRHLLSILFLALILQLGAAPATFSDTAQAQPVSSAPGSDAMDPDRGQDPFDLSLRSINLSQGEGGFEVWRLKAEWANVHKVEDLISLVHPRLSYFMREDDKVIYVQSDQGNVDQKNQILRFIEDVQVTQEDKVLTGPLLVYNGSARTMTMPEGASLRATGLDGSSSHLVWHIDTKVIEATGNVSMHMESAAPSGGAPSPPPLRLDGEAEPGQNGAS